MEPIRQAYIQMLTEKFDKDLPVADISHHRSKKIEESIATWQMDERANDISDSLEPLEKEHASNLNQKHYTAVDAYITGGLEVGETGSKLLNRHLIDRHYDKKPHETVHHYGTDHKTGQPLKTLNTDDLDDALKQNHLEHALTTYSGLGFDPRTILDHRNKLLLPAYTSSSTKRNVAFAYTKPHFGGEFTERHILKISHPKGSTGLYIGNNEDLSPFGQREHISPRNMKLTVNPDPEIHFDPKKNQKLFIWAAKRTTK